MYDVKEKKYKSHLDSLIAWPIIILLLYAVYLKNNLLYHTLAELFSVLIAYIVFLIIWKSKVLSQTGI
jgi:hypothetical protein